MGFGGLSPHYRILIGREKGHDTLTVEAARLHDNNGIEGASSPVHRTRTGPQRPGDWLRRETRRTSAWLKL